MSLSFIFSFISHYLLSFLHRARVEDLETPSTILEIVILPLNYTRILHTRMDLNHQPRLRIIGLEPTGHAYERMYVGPTGIEPMLPELQSGTLPTELRSQNYENFDLLLYRYIKCDRLESNQRL